ncbi:hypothetical protein NEUTE2DRAFT_129380 [Neurospora tetrasperma FGSC 2509]|nr:hypothetical protein NEUTE2DRAFT_129380 [Neurospora tetrasperma FGSC 2509]
MSLIGKAKMKADLKTWDKLPLPYSGYVEVTGDTSARSLKAASGKVTGGKEDDGMRRFRRGLLLLSPCGRLMVVSSEKDWVGGKRLVEGQNGKRWV